MVSQAIHDPDFDLAKGSSSGSFNSVILVRIIFEKKSQTKYNNLYRIHLKRSETIDIFLSVVSQANYDPDFDLA